jgi:GT2 family glycosyltransferase
MTNNKLQMTNQYQISKVNKNQKREIFKEMIEYSENKKLDALSPILVNPEGEIENCGYQVLPYGKIKLIRELPITDYPTSSRSPGLRGAIELDGLTAACLLIKTEVFKTLKGFNESFFAYLEDVDFFIRFKKAGYRFTVDPNIKVLHCQMTTSKQMGSFKERQDVINWWRLYFKHPDMFKFNIKFMIERLRNVSGFLKRVVAS